MAYSWLLHGVTRTSTSQPTIQVLHRERRAPDSRGANTHILDFSLANKQTLAGVATRGGDGGGVNQLQLRAAKGQINITISRHIVRSSSLAAANYASALSSEGNSLQKPRHNGVH